MDWARCDSMSRSGRQDTDRDIWRCCWLLMRINGVPVAPLGKVFGYGGLMCGGRRL
ncbi:hypothetical protein CY34DRAFT_798499 [Suillus luteus UH-Slu-Lm8-n1]|uniref:Uncharacterized protein n=1 Tax=Suillus luteus UH-Slu-Lm8-n1 TaxID=930992 RepID=A0A0D0BR02_9AGAM|nr:hypothetical protein CY34DRAFT_798499 [Suillus luteus UH-Slu-Lm8-n1]